MVNSSDYCPSQIASHINHSSGIILILVCIVVLLFNALIVFVIFGVKHRSLRWSLDYLVSFLAITDLCSTLVGVPIPIVAYFQGYWPGSCNSDTTSTLTTYNITCKVFFLFLVWGRMSTMFIITMMCIERFLAITKPFVHREIVTAGRLRRCVYVIWGSMFVYCILPLLKIGHVTLHWNRHLDGDSTSSEPSYFFCFMQFNTNGTEEFETVDLIYAIVFVVFGVVSLVIVLFCVFFICRILLVKKSSINKSSRISQKTIGKAYSVNAEREAKGEGGMKTKPSILEKGRTFISKRRPTIKKYEPEELQFIVLMFFISVIFYLTFLPTMLLVLMNILRIDVSESYTFWAMRLTSFVVVCNPLVYGLSNKLYRIGCVYVFKSIGAAFCCKKIPVPERLGPRRASSSILAGNSRAQMNRAEKRAQEFIIHSYQTKEEGIARTFVGKMRKGVEERKRQEGLEASKTVNFRTGTFLQETPQDLKNRDYFRRYHATRPLRQSSSSPLVTGPGLVTLAAVAAGGSPAQDPLLGAIMGRAASCVDLPSTRTTLREVVEEATRKPTGYIRRGLREKLAARAEEARVQVARRDQGVEGRREGARPAGRVKRERSASTGDSCSTVLENLRATAGDDNSYTLPCLRTGPNALLENKLEAVVDSNYITPTPE